MPIIPQETIEKILDSTNIVELIEGYFPLKRAGVNFVAVCPFHNEKSASFNVSPSRQAYHCFGCGAGGDAIGFVREYENLSFPEAVRKLADKAGVLIQEEEVDPKALARQRGRKDVLRMQKAAADFFHSLLLKKQIAQPARDYLKARGFGIEVAKTWKFGYAPEDQRMFFDWANTEGFAIPQLVEGGLAKWRDEDNPNRGAYSFFRHRLMFPVNNDMGEPIAFSGRVLSKEQKGGKYVNSPETSVFDKSKTFFGLDRSKRPILQNKRAIVFEGQLDLIAAFEGGIPNIVAPLGTAFTEHHAKILKRHTDEVILCYDSDTAGQNAAKKTFRVLAPSGMLVRLAVLPEGDDPDTFIRKFGIEKFQETLEASQEYFDHQVDRRGSSLNQGSLRERLGFAKELASDVALMDDKMIQDSLISRITVRLGVGEDDIRRLVMQAGTDRAKAEKSKSRRENQQKAREAESPDSKRVEPTVIPSRAIKFLCKALLTCPNTRAIIASKPIPDFFSDLTDTELLSRIWQSDVDPASPSSVNAFIGLLPTPDQICINRLLIEESPEGTPEHAEECLLSLKKQSIQNKIGVAKGQLGNPDISPTDVEMLQKLLLDLRSQLNDIARPR